MQLINNIPHYSFKTLQNTLGVSDRTLKRWQYPVKIKDPSDRRRVLYNFNKLKPKYQQKIIAALGDPSVDDLEDKPTTLDNYTDREIEIALTQFSLVMSYRQATDHLQHGKKTKAKKEWANLLQLGLLHKREVDILGNKVSFQSLERWDKLLRDGRGIMDDLLPLKTERQVTDSLTRDQQNELLAIYLGKNGLKKSQAVRLAISKWTHEGVEPLPSARRCGRFLNEWRKDNYDIETFRRLGEKALVDLVLPSISRDENSVEFMDLWVADGHVCNFQIANPLTGKLCRPTLIVWMDFATRIPVGYELMYTENTKAVLSAFRNGCLWVGRMLGIEGGVLPKCVYMDNGKAFKNKFFVNTSDFDNQIIGLFGRLRAYGLDKITFAWPYNARSKPVERFFGSFDFIEKRVGTYIGQNALAKPADQNRHEVWHKGQLLKYLNANGYPTLQGTYTIIRDYIENEFNLTPSRSKYLKGQAPLEKAQAQLDFISLEKRTLALDNFNYMLMHEKHCTLSKEGFIIDGIAYYNNMLFPGRIKGRKGYDYIVKYDILNPEKVWVYYAETGELWCTAGCSVWNKVHAMAALGSEADREHLKKAIDATQSIKKRSIKAAKAAGNGKFLCNSALPEHETVALPAKKKALRNKNLALSPAGTKPGKTDDDIYCEGLNMPLYFDENGRRVMLNPKGDGSWVILRGFYANTSYTPDDVEEYNKKLGNPIITITKKDNYSH